MSDDMEDRAARLKAGRKRGPNAAALVAVALVTGLAGGGVGVAYFLKQEAPTGPVLDTSSSREFQRDLNTELSPVITPAPVLREVEQGPSESELALQQRVAELEQSLENARKTVPRLHPVAEAVDTPLVAELQSKVVGLVTAMETRETEMTAIIAERDQLARDAMRQEAELDGLNLRLEQAATDQLEEMRLSQEQQDAELAEQRRREELEQRRAEAAAIRNAQINSSIDGLSGGGGGNGERDYTGDEAFIRAGSDTIEPTQSRVIGAPSNTILQGTVIEATLTTGINSQLSGTITSTVSFDVWSFDMSQVLIPRGSQMFGRYSNGVVLGQQRVLVAWDRVVTPNGQVVDLEAYGSDRLGRSGLTGDVNNRVGERFGAAAAISVFSVFPALAASRAENETAVEVAEQLGTDARDSATSIVEQYLSLAPIITVEHGDIITVMVTNDLELF